MAPEPGGGGVDPPPRAWSDPTASRHKAAQVAAATTPPQPSAARGRTSKSVSVMLPANDTLSAALFAGSTEKTTLTLMMTAGSSPPLGVLDRAMFLASQAAHGIAAACPDATGTFGLPRKSRHTGPGGNAAPVLIFIDVSLPAEQASSLVAAAAKAGGIIHSASPHLTSPVPLRLLSQHKPGAIVDPLVHRQFFRLRGFEYVAESEVLPLLKLMAGLSPATVPDLTDGQAAQDMQSVDGALLPILGSFTVSGVTPADKRFPPYTPLEFLDSSGRKVYLSIEHLRGGSLISGPLNAKPARLAMAPQLEALYQQERMRHADAASRARQAGRGGGGTPVPAAASPNLKRKAAGTDTAGGGAAPGAPATFPRIPGPVGSPPATAEAAPKGPDAAAKPPPLVSAPTAPGPGKAAVSAPQPRPTLPAPAAGGRGHGHRFDEAQAAILVSDAQRAAAMGQLQLIAAAITNGGVRLPYLEACLRQLGPADVKVLLLLPPGLEQKPPPYSPGLYNRALGWIKDVEKAEAAQAAAAAAAAEAARKVAEAKATAEAEVAKAKAATATATVAAAPTAMDAEGTPVAEQAAAAQAAAAAAAAEAARKAAEAKAKATAEAEVAKAKAATAKATVEAAPTAMDADSEGTPAAAALVAPAPMETTGGAAAPSAEMALSHAEAEAASVAAETKRLLAVEAARAALSSAMREAGMLLVMAGAITPDELDHILLHLEDLRNDGSAFGMERELTNKLRNPTGGYAQVHAHFPRGAVWTAFHSLVMKNARRLRRHIASGSWETISGSPASASGGADATDAELDPDSADAAMSPSPPVPAAQAPAGGPGLVAPPLASPSGAAAGAARPAPL